MNEIYYVYALLDPRKPGVYQYRESPIFDYEPFYIGKGKGNRCNEHFGQLREAKKELTYKAQKIRSIFKKSGKYPIIIKLYEKLNVDVSYEVEKFLIKQIGRKDLNKGPLTNLTDGGDGPYNISLEVRKRWSEIRKNPSQELRYQFGKSFRGKKRPDHSKFLKDYYKDHLGPNTGKSPSEETRKKLSISGKGKKHNITKKRGPLPEEVKQKLRKSRSEETKQKMRKPKTKEHIENMKKAWISRRKKIK